MKNNTIALEISHKYIKVAFGYVQDGQVFINFVKKAPINHFLENGIIKDGKFIDGIFQEEVIFKNIKPYKSRYN